MLIERVNNKTTINGFSYSGQIVESLLTQLGITNFKIDKRYSLYCRITLGESFTFTIWYLEEFIDNITNKEGIEDWLLKTVKEIVDQYKKYNSGFVVKYKIVKE